MASEKECQLLMEEEYLLPEEEEAERKYLFLTKEAINKLYNI
jgi:hypothetical protein